MANSQTDLMADASFVPAGQSEAEIQLQKDLERITEISNYLLLRSTQIIERVRPLISFQEIPFLYNNSITCLSGGKGSYKSRVTESAISCLFQMETTATGFKREEGEMEVLYIDTERSIIESLPLAIQRIKNQSIADIKLQLPNFIPYSLIEIPRERRLNLLKATLQKHRQNTDKKIVLVLDVASDMIEDFNNVAQSMTFLDYLNVLIAQFNVSVLLLIHENPGSTTNKQRGHLGTEAMNKSSVVISLENKTDVIRLKYLHIRETKNPGIFNLKYDDALHCLIPISEAEAELSANEKIEKIKLVLPSILNNAVRNRKELEKEVMGTTGLSDRIVHDCLGIIIKSKESLPYNLKTEKVGRITLYSIESQESLNV